MEGLTLYLDHKASYAPFASDAPYPSTTGIFQFPLSVFIFHSKIKTTYRISFIIKSNLE